MFSYFLFNKKKKKKHHIFSYKAPASIQTTEKELKGTLNVEKNLPTYLAV